MKKVLKHLDVGVTPEQFDMLQFLLIYPDKVWAENVWHMIRIKKLEVEAMQIQFRARKRTRPARIAA